ncbi:hypothetical protein CC2G_001436 [Coprinopsis cinerea AmutBmut pab1-1]|nr:hypothetical protein CC2G_001436 [Coprinopsis cinerea AmutBmut pab1-1]
MCGTVHSAAFIDLFIAELETVEGLKILLFIKASPDYLPFSFINTGRRPGFKRVGTRTVVSSFEHIPHHTGGYIPSISRED